MSLIWHPVMVKSWPIATVTTKSAAHVHAKCRRPTYRGRSFVAGVGCEGLYGLGFISLRDLLNLGIFLREACIRL